MGEIAVVNPGRHLKGHICLKLSKGKSGSFTKRTRIPLPRAPNIPTYFGIAVMYITEKRKLNECLKGRHSC